MRRYNISKKSRRIDNQGFSLIELIISIAVLVIIMIPLMNSFYQSMLMNKKAENIQKQTNLAANIMEGLKNLNMEDTIDQFTGVDSFDIFGSGNPTVLEPAGAVYGEMNPINYSTLDGQANYYFAINGINIDGTAYDALIEMNAADYRTVTDIMNDYSMPDAINLDKSANALFFSNGASDKDDPAVVDTVDDQALTAYIQMGDAYARQLFGQTAAYQNYLIEYDNWQNARETAAMKTPPDPSPTPLPVVAYNPLSYPEYTDLNTVKATITKTMKVIINNTAKTVEYQINYNRVWPAGCSLSSSLQYQISVNTYPAEINNVYLFYRPSIFSNTKNDQIEIDNTTSATYPMNFYLANQASSVTKEVIISKSATDQTAVYTNISPLLTTLKVGGMVVDDSQFNTGIVKTEQRDRIYETTVNIYQYVNSTNMADKYKKLLYSISSSREK